MDEWLSNLVASAPKATLNDVRTHAQVVAAKPPAAYREFSTLDYEDSRLAA